MNLEPLDLSSSAVRPSDVPAGNAAFSPAVPPRAQQRRTSALQLTMTPDLGNEHFTLNSSGVALQYKLWGIEQVRSATEKAFIDALRGLLAVLTAGERLLGRGVDLTGGTATFYKNLPQDNAALCSTLLSLAPLLSRQTILLPLSFCIEPYLCRKATIG